MKVQHKDLPLALLCQLPIGMVAGQAVVRTPLNVNEHVDVEVVDPQVVDGVLRAKLVPVNGATVEDLRDLVGKESLEVEQGGVVYKVVQGVVPVVPVNTSVSVDVEGSVVELVGKLASRVSETSEVQQALDVPRRAQ